MSGAALVFGMSATQLAVVLGTGVAAGFLNTMAGGGSLLTLPALMLLGLPADVANGTNRLGVATQSVSGAFAFHRAGKLDPRSIAPILAPTVIGSLIGSAAAASVPKAWLKPVLLGSMTLVALVMAAKPGAFSAPGGSTPLSLRERPLATFGLFVAGLYGGFVQAGVGFLLLGVLGGMLRYDLARANALKILCTLVFGSVALVVFIIADQVAWVPACVLAVATVVGSQLGARFALRAPDAVLRWLIFGCVVATGLAALLKK